MAFWGPAVVRPRLEVLEKLLTQTRGELRTLNEEVVSLRDQQRILVQAQMAAAARVAETARQEAKRAEDLQALEKKLKAITELEDLQKMGAILKTDQLEKLSTKKELQAEELLLRPSSLTHGAEARLAAAEARVAAQLARLEAQASGAPGAEAGQALKSAQEEAKRAGEKATKALEAVERLAAETKQAAARPGGGATPRAGDGAPHAAAAERLERSVAEVGERSDRQVAELRSQLDGLAKEIVTSLRSWSVEAARLEAQSAQQRAILEQLGGQRRNLDDSVEESMSGSPCALLGKFRLDLDSSFEVDPVVKAPNGKADKDAGKQSYSLLPPNSPT